MKRIKKTQLFDLIALWSSRGGRLLGAAEAELRSPLHEHGDEVPDGPVVQQAVFLRYDGLDCGSVLVRKTLREPFDDSHEGFGFCGHCQSLEARGGRGQ
jgi:hypothetical protein